MNDKQLEIYGSLAKSYDFLDDYEDNTVITNIVQIPVLTTLLGGILDQIIEADGIGSQNNTGVTTTKKNLRTELETKFFKIAKAAKAYYASISDTSGEATVTFKKSIVGKWDGDTLYSKAKKLVKDATPIAANLVGAILLDVTALNTAAEAFNNAIPDTKRAIEFSKIHNAKIDPLLRQGRETQAKIDIFMDTLSDDQPDLYAEWAETMNIDRQGANNPAAHTINLSVEAGQVTNVDYIEFAMQNNSEIKLINNNAAIIEYGFGSTDTTFAGEPTTVNETSQERKTAVALGYHSIESNLLNVRNNSGTRLNVTLEFYDMG